MDVILDKSTNLKRLRSDLSKDSSAPKSTLRNTKNETKKSKIKKKLISEPLKEENHPLSVKSQKNPENNMKLDNIDTGDDTTSMRYWYDRSNKAPFIVFVRKLGDRASSKSISVIEASRLLLKANIRFNEIEYHAWNTWKISFNSYQEANSAIRNKFLEKLGLTLYIPKYKVFRKGVIKGIPCDISLDEILTTLVEKEQPSYLYRQDI